MASLFLKLVNMSLSAGWLVLAVLAVRLLFKRAPKWLHCLLWGLVAVRLVCPVTVESVLSLIPSAEPIPPTFITSPSPEVDTGLPELDAMLNPGLSGSLTTPPENSVNASQVLAFAATVLWVVGMVCMAVYALVSTLRLRYRVRESMPLEAGVRVCDGIPSPFILGVFRPRIYLPPGLSGEQTTYVLAHERAHLKRCDHLWKPLGWLLLTVYWFNPLLWVAYVFLCRDIEQACDEKVVRDMAVEGRKAYSAALLACSAPRRLISACPLAFGESGVKQRIKSVLHYKKPAFWLIVVAAVACVAVAVCFLTNPPSAKVDGALERLIVDTVKAEHRTDAVDDRYPCVAYTVFGTEKEEDTVTVYGRMLYQEYVLDDSLRVAYEAPYPFALTAKTDGTAYTLVEYWTPPRDDSAWDASIRERFPRRHVTKALDAQRYAEKHRTACREQAEAYFGVQNPEAYVPYVCDANGTSFWLDYDKGRCGFTAHQLCSYRIEGDYTLTNDRLTMMFPTFTLVFQKRAEVFVFDEAASDPIPDEVKFGAEYTLADGTVFYRNINREVGYQQTLFRMNWVSDTLRAQLFASVPAVDHTQYQPAFCFRTRGEWERFIRTYWGDALADGSEWAVGMQEKLKVYDDAFFTDYALLVAYYHDESCSVTPYLLGLEYAEDGSGIVLQMAVYEPNGQDEAHGEWFITAGIPQNAAASVKTVRASVRNSTSQRAALFTGTVQKVDEQKRRLLLNSKAFNGQVWVTLDEEMPLYRKGDELFVVYNGLAETTDPPFVGAMRIGLRESLSFRMEYYADRVVETAVEKTATTLTAIGLEERAAELQVVLATAKWVPDAILDRLTLYFDGFVTLPDGTTLYFDLKDGHLYNKAEGMLAALSAEGKELLGSIKTMAATATTSGSTTGRYWPYSYPMSTIAGNPTTAPNRAPNAKGVVNIVDWTTIYSPALGAMLETFYEDDGYTYYFNCVKSMHVRVHYADGSFKPLKEALAAGDVTVADLEDFGIEFAKTRKGTTAPPTTVKKTTTTKKPTTTTAKKEGFEVQFLRVERLNPSVKVGGKDIWELFAPLNGHGVLTQIGDKIIYRIINYEKDSGRYVGTGDSMNCTVEISGDIATVTVATDGNHAGPFVSADFWVYDQNGTRIGEPNFSPQNPGVQFIDTRSSVVKNGVVDTGVVAMMLRHYGDAHMHCPYGELTESGVAEKVIPVTAGTEWIDTAVKTLKSYSLNGYEYYKLSLKDDTLTLRFAKKM